jgi:hypothetical protein
MIRNDQTGMISHIIATGMLLDDVSATSERFDSELVCTSELDEERQRTSDNMSEWHPRGEKQPPTNRRRSNAQEKGSRRPKAGHYPVGYSPYSMSAKRGVVPLARLLIKRDLKVILARNVFFCMYALFF